MQIAGIVDCGGVGNTWRHHSTLRDAVRVGDFDIFTLAGEQFRTKQRTKLLNDVFLPCTSSRWNCVQV